MPVRVALWVRRFFCRNADCQRQIFCERLNPAIEAYPRRTRRLENQLQQLSLALGGEGGSRLLMILGMSASPATLLRLIGAIEIDERPTPRVLGVDDWAKHKGQSYGTILVDLERHQPVDLLAERSSEALANWLQAHPGVEIITRDRAEVYAEGASTGAPDAIQIADRFHLMQNLVDTLKRMFDHHANDLQAAAKQATVPLFGICDPVKEDFGSSESSTSIASPLEQQNGGLEIAVDNAPADNVRLRKARNPWPSCASTRSRSFTSRA